MNIENMTSKELKEMAKELHVKNWWNLKKAELIAAIQEAQNAAEESEESEKSEEVEETESEEVTENLGATLLFVPVASIAPAESEEAPKEVKKPSLGIKELTFNGRTQSIKAWAEELKMPWPTLYDRINRNGWTVEEALTIPLGGRRRR